MKLSDLLGLNARTKLFSYKYNKASAKRKAISKLSVKKALALAGIPVPEIYAKFVSQRQVFDFNWTSLPKAFALKPSRGYGGEGIIIAKKKELSSASSAEGKEPISWITTDKKRVGIEDLKLHVLDILEGAYSVGNVPDVAFIEEYIGRHKALRKFSYRGTPDIRVIVFNKVPVMAMLRLPTKGSYGRANLHQGAIGVGVDIATGITTRAILDQEYIKYKPGTKKKLHGIKIPFWNDVLKIAVSCQIATGIGYLGVDLILHPEKGPMVLELNYMPGLQIQLANGAGLLRRLSRVEDLEILDVAHGVTVAKALFSSSLTRRVKQKDEEKMVISPLEQIKIKTTSGSKHKALAKIDTGAWRTSIDKNLAKELGLLEAHNIIKTRTIRSSLGHEERPVIALTYWLKGIKITTMAGVADRRNLKRRIIIGRRDLGNFLVNPVLSEEAKYVVQ